MTSLDGKLRLAAGHFGLPTPFNQQVKKGSTVLARVISLTIKGKLSQYSKKG